MGKYTALRSKLPAFEEEQSYQQKIDEAKLWILGSTDNPEQASVQRLARLFAEHKAKKKDLEEQLADVNLGLNALSQLLVDAMEEQGANKLELTSGGSIGIKDTPYTGIEDRATIMKWIKKNKLEGILSVQYQTLSGMNNERLVNGKPLIPGTKVWMKTSAQLYGVSSNGDSE